MKRFLFLSIPFVICISCSINNDLEKIKSENKYLITRLDSLEGIKSSYIDIAFSDLILLYESDSVYFNESMIKKGFVGRHNILFAKPETFENQRDSLSGIGIGHYYFEELQTIVKTWDWRTLMFTFPVSRLCYYKQSILNQGFNMNDQEVAFNDRYNKYYITETYIDVYRNLKYSLSYTDNYCLIKISR